MCNHRGEYDRALSSIVGADARRWVQQVMDLVPIVAPTASSGGAGGKPTRRQDGGCQRLLAYRGFTDQEAPGATVGGDPADPHVAADIGERSVGALVDQLGDDHIGCSSLADSTEVKLVAHRQRHRAAGGIDNEVRYG